MRNKATHSVLSPLIVLCLKILLIQMAMSQQENKTIPVNVGVVLDMDTWFGKMGLSCISMALSDFYASHGNYKTRLVLHTRDSNNDVVDAAAAAIDLIKNVEVQAIIGPITSMQADFIVDLGNRAQVPIISFSATSPSIISSTSMSSYFFRAALNDSSQVQAISAIIQAFGWREAVLIYVGDKYGEGVIPLLTLALQQINTHVPYLSVIPPSATDDELARELYKLVAMQTRVFIVHVLPASLSSRVFQKAKEIGMMSEGFVWIVTDGIGNLLSSMDPSAIESMQGILGVKTFVPETKMLQDFRVRWKRKFQQDNPTIPNYELNIYGLWAYDAALALATAAEKINMTNSSFQKKINISGNNPTDLETLGTSLTGPNIHKALSNTRFDGLTGDFHFVDGQLQSLPFQFVNVIGKGERVIGFWTPRDGISRKLITTNTSTTKDSLGAIFWPGETTSVPKGWAVPTMGKRLRVGVPIRNDTNNAFVQVTIDSSNKTISVTGYCIDVFKAVMEALPYPVPYDFIPFPLILDTGSCCYNDMLYQVTIKSLDAVVADTTIMANRSLYVDFTLPYTESGFTMVVPIKDKKIKNPWVFFKPLTLDLWVTIACFFVFIGFVIWILEHRINEDFRGPPLHQVGMIFWFSFSTMVYAHREKVLGNLARFVVIIWLFVVLILTLSYTASLTSMLTVQQLQSTPQRGEYVGYQKGSFVLGLLKKMKFDESKLRPYNSLEELDEALTNGSANGGISAVYDETPYMKLFLAQFCSKYTMVGPVVKTGGFGFVFQKGSPLVADVSRAILNVIESETMTRIENVWFGNQSRCTDTSTPDPSFSLGLDSFWGLFLIAGAASVLAVLIYAAMFLYAHWHVFTQFDPESSVWRKTILLLRHFDKKDISFHTFVKKEARDRSVVDGIDRMCLADEASPKNNFAPSPSNCSTPLERVLSIELVNVPNDQERPGIVEIAHESN